MYTKEFLDKLFLHNEREIYAKVLLLSFDEMPLGEIQGRISQGSINIDGNSSVRRSSSLSIVCKEIDINDFYWGLNTKYKLSIGIKNLISEPEIIWFDQGVYVINSFSSQQSVNNYTINISGKDKMCLLNGECGGNISGSVDFGKIEKINKTGDSVFEDILLKDIIRNLLIWFGGEKPHNIIINDLELYGVELLEYRGDKEIYLTKDASGTYSQVVFDEPTSGEYKTITNDGKAIGYRATDLTYPGDLISSIGETATAVLDKIKNILGDFEYFYDIDGKFIFQRKKTYTNIAFNSIKKDPYTGEEYADNAVAASAEVFSLTNRKLITAFNNTPNLLNVKNDFSIWGQKDGIQEKIPIHLRCAIEEIPQYYARPQKWLKDVNKPENYEVEKYNWREILYQMASDYYSHGTDEDFYEQIREANKDYYPSGYTGYENYYYDIFSFWRDICPEDKVKEFNEEKLNFEALYFWIDFIDSEKNSELAQFSTRAIGTRAKVINDSNVKAIKYSEIPNVIFSMSDNDFSEYQTPGYSKILIPSYLAGAFDISAQGKSAFDVLEENLYNFTYCAQSTSITTIPIYNLQPNTRIYVYDEQTKIDGEYLISKITIPLTYNGTQSITAVKAIDRIL